RPKEVGFSSYRVCAIHEHANEPHKVLAVSVLPRSPPEAVPGPLAVLFVYEGRLRARRVYDRPEIAQHDSLAEQAEIALRGYEIQSVPREFWRPAGAVT